MCCCVSPDLPDVSVDSDDGEPEFHVCSFSGDGVEPTVLATAPSVSVSGGQTFPKDVSCVVGPPVLYGQGMTGCMGVRPFGED